MSTVNEFVINLPLTSVGAAGLETNPTPAPDQPSPVDVTASYTLPAGVDASACDHIVVHMDSATIMNYDPKSPTILVDMVLSVGVTDPSTGSSKNYKMVKRISMDKCKLACDAESLTPVQVVEAEDDPLEVAQIMERFYAAKRAREMAGLTESAGTKAFNVLFQFDAKPSEDGGKAINGGSVVIDAVKDKAHARHVFDMKHGKNKKYPNIKIIRVTEVK